MRIAIVAPGGVDGCFRGLLAKAGENVTALARGTHLAAIKADGLRVEGPRGDDSIRLDVSEDAARVAAPLFGPETLGISLLNGIGGQEMIARNLPGATVLAGCAYVSAVIAAPGHVRYTGEMPSIVFGAPTGSDRARVKAADFAERCRRSSFGAEMIDNVCSALWNKLIGLAANAAFTSAARLPAGSLYSDPDVIEVAAALIGETTAVARAAGANLPADIEETWLARIKGFPPGMYASMYHDIARGGPLEVDGFSGHVVREGRRLGVPTPHHAALYAVLKPYRAGRPQL